MKLLVVSQYFWPETFIINDLVKVLSSAEHEVTVVTGKPNYPDGKIFEGYAASGVTREKYAGVIDVIRVPIRPRKNGGGLNLLLNYLSFIFSASWRAPRYINAHNFDAILVFAPSPITSAIPAAFLKGIKGAHLAIWVQDLWPESLSATGFIRNPALLRLVGWLVRAIYGSADTVLVQSKAFIDPVSRYCRPEKIVYYPNSCQDPTRQSAVSTEVPAELLQELDRNFSLVFAGNLGTAQSVETLVQAAERLKHLPSCKLVLVGSGSMLGWIKEQKVLRGLDNLILAGRFPPSEMTQFFSRAAGLLVTLKREAAFAHTIPSKVQAYLAAGRPLIAALDGEGARVVEEARAGFACPAEDVDGLVRCIEHLFRMSPAEREKLGRSGREYFLAHFEMTRQSQRLVEILETRISEGRGRSK